MDCEELQRVKGGSFLGKGEEWVTERRMLEELKKKRRHRWWQVPSKGELPWALGQKSLHLSIKPFSLSLDYLMSCFSGIRAKRVEGT